MAELTGHLKADFSKFFDAVTQAQLKLTSFQTDATKVGSALSRMGDSFSGKQVIQNATLMAQAVERIGGVGKLTDDELKRLQGTLGTAIEKARAMGIAVPESLTKMHEEATKAQASFADIATALTGIGVAVTGVAAGLTQLGARGADVADVREQFEILTGTIGISADTLTTKLQAATLNTVSRFELMKTVNQGLSQGLKLTADQFEQTADVAAVLADRVGGDTKQAFDTLVQAMSTGQDRQLKTIGLNIDAAAAAQAYASSLNKLASELTEEEKKQATVNAILQEGDRILQQSGKAQEDFGDQVAQAQAKLSDFVDGIGEWIATHGGIGQWAAAVTTASGALTAISAVAGPLYTKLADAGVWASMQRGLSAIGIQAGSAAAALGAVGIAIASIWAAWEIGKTDVVSDTIERWALTSENLTAALYRNVMGIDKLTEAQAAEAMSGNKAAKAADDKRKAQEAQIKLMEDFARRTAEQTAAQEAARQKQEELAKAQQRKREAEQQAKAAVEAHTREIERQQKALEALGIVTKASVNRELAEFVTIQKRAVAEGVDLDKVLIAQLPKLKELTKRAEQSGVAVEGLAEAYKAAGEAWARSMDPAFDRIEGGTLPAGLRASTEELERLNRVMSPDEWNAIQATDAMRRMGIDSRAELEKTARQAERDYAAIVAAVGRNAPEAVAAYQRMIEAQRALTGEIPTYWESTVLPSIKLSIAQIGNAMSDNFAAMLTGLTGFKDGFVNIWHSIRDALANILSDMLNTFVSGFLKGMIGAITGQHGAFSKAFEGLFGGLFGGGGGKATEAVVGGATSAATAGGTAAITGGTAGTAGGTLGSHMLAFATNPVTIAAIGAAVVGWGVGQKGWFRGCEEALKVNPARDEWFADMQAKFEEALTPYQAAIRALGEAGIAAKEVDNLMKKIYAADTMKEFEAAVQKVNTALTEAAAKRTAAEAKLTEEVGATPAAIGAAFEAHGGDIVEGFKLITTASSDKLVSAMTLTRDEIRTGRATLPDDLYAVFERHRETWKRELVITFAAGSIVIQGAQKDPQQLAREIAPALVDVILRENPDGARTTLRRGLTE